MKNHPPLHHLPTTLLLAVGLGLLGVRHAPSPDVPAATAAAPLDAQAPPHEGFSFQMRDYSINHQGLNTLNVNVRYAYREGLRPEDYPDFQDLDKTCDEFFAHYPNPDTFWEVLNKELTSKLLEEFPALSSVTIEIQVSPTARIPFPRASTVTRTRL